MLRCVPIVKLSFHSSAFRLYAFLLMFSHSMTLFLFFGDMTLVTYLRKSFSMREDDSCAPHSPHTMSIQQVRPFGLGGFGVFLLYFSVQC